MSSPKRVLIIDDHDSVREGLELLMRRRGHRTVSARDGKEGLQVLEDVGADLVITDMKMATEEDGIRVLKGVQHTSPNTDVLVITAHGTVEIAVEAMKLGARDFISKPFMWEEFGIKWTAFCGSGTSVCAWKRRTSPCGSRTPISAAKRGTATPRTAIWWGSRRPSWR